MKNRLVFLSFIGFFLSWQHPICATITLTGSLTWDGNEARYLSEPAPNATNGNLAMEAEATAIAKDVLLPENPGHQIDHLNDGIYGNGNSWIGNSESTWAGIAFGGWVAISSFAFGRDNVILGITDRALGTYIVQYTTDELVSDGGNWVTIGTIQYSGSDEGLYRRHEYQINSPVEVSGLRLWVPNGTCIDELECFGPSDPNAAPPQLRSGKFGRALKFRAGAPYWVEAPCLTEYLQLPITVECWTNLYSPYDYNLLIAAQVKESSDHWELATAIDTGEFFAYLPGHLPVGAGTGVDIVDNQWHYIAMILESTRTRLFVDGVLKTDVPITSGSLPPGSDGYLYFGAYPPHQQGCSGLLDEVRITSGIREMIGIPAAPFVADASTIGLWHFDQYGANGFEDASLRNNPAQFVPPPANPVLQIQRGITLDRQYRTMPPEAIMRFQPEDIQIIKTMGFDFVKLIVNPALHKSGSGLNDANMYYLDTIVNTVLNQGLNVVVCIHPEPDFKTAELGDTAEFPNLLGFYEAFAGYMAARWSPNQLAFQLMTEPFGNVEDWNIVQPQMWEAVRRGMPDHTLILSGDQAGQISGLLQVQPVNDSNVLYTFTTYEPFFFTLQGAKWIGSWWSYLSHVPYPSSPEIIASVLIDCVNSIPDSPPEWRTQVQAQALTYGTQNWNKAKQASRIQRIVDWNEFYGGGLGVWCAEFGALGPGQGTVTPEYRYAFIQDLREVFEENAIGWAYWSYNETFSVLTPDRIPFGPPDPSKGDALMLEALGLGNTAIPNWSFY